jgi:hypothetical protein
MFFCFSFVFPDDTRQREFINVGLAYENTSQITSLTWLLRSNDFFQRKILDYAVEMGGKKDKKNYFGFIGFKFLSFYEKKINVGFCLSPLDDNNTSFVFYSWLGSTIRLKDNRPLFFRLYLRQERLLFMVSTPLFW